MNKQAMSDLEINKAVAKARGGYGGKTNNKYSPNEVVCFDEKPFHTERDFCNRAEDAWPIIVENKITVSPMASGDKWAAMANVSVGGGYSKLVESAPDSNPLRAAMIVYLIRKEQDSE